MPAAEDACAPTDSVFDDVNHALHMLRPNHGADVAVGIIAGAEAQLFRFCNTARGEFIAHGLLDEEAFDGEAHLAAIGIAAPHRCACGAVDVTITEYDHGALPSHSAHGGTHPLS